MALFGGTVAYDASAAIGPHDAISTAG
jgi:hypothetical protein